MEVSHYATREDLAQLETRVVERIVALESRLEREMRESEAARRQPGMAHPRHRRQHRRRGGRHRCVISANR